MKARSCMFGERQSKCSDNAEDEAFILISLHSDLARDS
jgi:hypothetical protein